jgi:hypothetical protein
MTNGWFPHFIECWLNFLVWVPRLACSLARGLQQVWGWGKKTVRIREAQPDSSSLRAPIGRQATVNPRRATWALTEHPLIEREWHQGRLATRLGGYRSLGRVPCGVTGQSVRSVVLARCLGARRKNDAWRRGGRGGTGWASAGGWAAAHGFQKKAYIRSIQEILFIDKGVPGWDLKNQQNPQCFGGLVELNPAQAKGALKQYQQGRAAVYVNHQALPCPSSLSTKTKTTKLFPWWHRGKAWPLPARKKT